MFGTDFIIVSGFLGTGKTTFITKFGKKISSKDQKIGILVNDFGEVTIDGDTLEDFGMDAKRINKGCVCCEVKQDLVTQIRELKEAYSPDLILLETSGVASILPIQKTVDSYVDETNAITLVDVTRHEKLMESFETVKNQLISADFVLINKIDQVSEEKVKETRKKIDNYLKKENPQASVSEISAKKGNGFEEIVKKVI